MLKQNFEHLSGQRTTRTKVHNGVEEVCQHAIDQDREGWHPNATHDLANLATMEPEADKVTIEKISLHPVVGSIHIQLDGHMTMLNRGSL